MGILRLFLALSVFFIHAPIKLPLRFPDGTLAVRAFYSISAFYIAMVWTKKYSRMEKGKAVFWLNRWLRLAPAYIAVSCIIAYSSIHATGSFRKLGDFSFLTQIGVVFSHIFLVGQDLFSFFICNLSTHSCSFAADALDGKYGASAVLFPGWYFQSIGQGWTIGIEIWFYLMAPFFVTWRFRNLALLFLGSILCRLLTEHYFPENMLWSYRFFPNELCYFIAGIFAYRFYCAYDSVRIKPLGWPILSGIIVLGCALFSYQAAAPSAPQWPFQLYGYLVVISIPFVFAASKDSKWDTWVGNLSFPIYIVHMFCIEQYMGNSLGTMLLNTFAASLAIVYLIEKPVEVLRQRLVDRFRATG